MKTLIAGRGFGKSSVIALILYNMFAEMPKAHVAFVALSFGQVKNLSLAAIKKQWIKLGLAEGIHFVVGKKPPKNFDTPYQEVEDYKNVITFCNGFTISLISAKTSNTSRGGSYDALIFDEAAFYKEAFYNDILAPSVRGYKRRFIQKATNEPSRWYLSQTIMSSRPRDGAGRWIYRFKELAKQKPEQYAYMEASARDNLDALGGEEWFEMQRDTLGALVYAVEIENVDLERLPDGYYHRFDDARNVYYPTHDRDNKMTDIDTNRLLSLSFDFGGWFTCATLWQEKNGTEYQRREFFVKETGTLDTLVQDIINHLDVQQFKLLHIYGDPNGYNKTAFTDAPAYTMIQRAFERAGWSVQVMAQKSYIELSHNDRRVFLNTMLDESNAMLPKIQYNKLACPNSIIAIGLTDVNPDGSKNKKLEKDRNYPQQHAPHLTDTSDYYLVPKWSHDNKNSTRSAPGKVWTK